MSDRPARVAMLAHTCYLTDPRVRREAEALTELGVCVHVIALSEKRNGVWEPRESVVNGVRVHRLPVSRRRGGILRYVYEYLLTGILGAIELTRLYLSARLDVIHIHNMPDLLVLAAAVPRMLGCKLLLDVHDPMPELYMSWNHDPRGSLVRILRFQERISCSLADRVISVNDTMREALTAKGVNREKIVIVHNFPDSSHFPVADLPTRWPKAADSLVLLYCGTVTEHYDLSLAVRAMATLSGEIPIRLKIMGDGNRLSEVLSLASALNIREAIELVGKVPIERVAEEMRKADVGVSCHRAGLFGDLYFSTKILEYLSQGLPVVTARTYTINRYLPDDSVFYFKPGSHLALAAELRHMWRNPDEVMSRLERAMALLSKLSWQTEKARFWDFYADLLQPGGGRDGSPSDRLCNHHRA